MKIIERVKVSHALYFSFLLYASLCCILRVYIDEIEIDLDAAYSWGFNFISSRGSGWDSAFTFGPLGFLIGRFFNFGHQFEIKLVFQFLLSILASFSIYRWSFVAFPKRAVPRIFAGVLLAVLVLSNREYIPFAVILVLCWTALIDESKNVYIYLSATWPLVAATLLIKLSLGLAGLLLVMLTSFLVQGRLMQRFLRVGSSFVTVVAIMLFFWTSLGFPLQDFSNYLTLSLEVVSGYSSSMTNYLRDSTGGQILDAYKQWLRIVQVYTILSFFILFLAFSIEKRHRWIFTLFWAGPTFLLFKHSTNRLGEVHLSHFPLYWLLAVGLLIFSSFAFKPALLGRKWKVFAVTFLVFLGMIDAIRKFDIKHMVVGQLKDTFIHITTNRFNVEIKNLTHKEELQKNADLRTQENRKRMQLPLEMKEIIGDSKVDIYPYALYLIPFNNFNWANRPAPVSFQGYTKKTDILNSEFLKSESAATYYIFHDGYLTIDNIPTIWAEPATLMSLLSHYHPMKFDDKFILLKREPKDLLVKTLREESIAWDEWISLPETDNGYIVADVISPKTFSLKMRKAFLRDEPLAIELELKNGEIHEFKFLPENSMNGLVLSPFPMSKLDFREFFALKSKQNVKRVRFASKAMKGQLPNLTVKWKEYSLE